MYLRMGSPLRMQPGFASRFPGRKKRASSRSWKRLRKSSELTAFFPACCARGGKKSRAADMSVSCRSDINGAMGHRKIRPRRTL
jgi:hypothetical protein